MIHVLFIMTFLGPAGAYGAITTTQEFTSAESCAAARAELNRKAGDRSDSIVSWCQPKALVKEQM